MVYYAHLSKLLLVFIIITTLPVRCIEEIKTFTINNNGYDKYSFEFETSGGTYRREDGGFVPGRDSLVVRGEYGYIDSGGRLYTLRYLADVNGFQPERSEHTVRYNDRKII